MYYRARYYDPTTGRFVSRDPLEYVDGMNMYEYVKGNPANFVDPEGQVPASGIFAGGMAIGRFGIGLYALEEWRRCMVAANEMTAYARAIMEPCAFENWEKTARPIEGCNELLKQGLTNLGQSAGWFFGTWATLRNAAYGTSTYR